MFQIVFLSQKSFVELLIEPTGLPIGFPLVPFLNGILYNRKYALLFEVTL